MELDLSFEDVISEFRIKFFVLIKLKEKLVFAIFSVKRFEQSHKEGRKAHKFEKLPPLFNKVLCYEFHRLDNFAKLLPQRLVLQLRRQLAEQNILDPILHLLFLVGEGFPHLLPVETVSFSGFIGLGIRGISPFEFILSSLEFEKVL